MKDNIKDFNSEYMIELIQKYSRPASEILIDNVDLRTMLKISRRTALVYRKMGIFPYYKIEGKFYYLLSEVIAGIKEKGGNHGN